MVSAEREELADCHGYCEMFAQKTIFEFSVTCALVRSRSVGSETYHLRRGNLGADPINVRTMNICGGSLCLLSRLDTGPKFTEKK